MENRIKEVRVRFAPSPTGFLHVGNARTALFNYFFAKGLGGKFILRIEDTDIERSNEEWIDGIMRAMRWMGIQWDEGPDIGGHYGPYLQSQRLELYKTKANELIANEKAYYCFCSEEEIKEQREAMIAEGIAPKYSGKCRLLDINESLKKIEAGERAAIRFKVEEKAPIIFKDLVRGTIHIHPKTIGDFIIIRSNGMPAYNFAVVVDDATMNITHVIRGEDHISNTPKQILLYKALQYDIPIFGHLPMILGPDGSRLSKRHGATAVEQFQEMGYLPEAFTNYLALLGWAPPSNKEILTIDEIIKLFNIKEVGKSASIFDEKKLAWVSSCHLRNKKNEEIAELAFDYLYREGLINKEKDANTMAWLAKAISSIKTHLEKISDIVKYMDIFYNFSPEQAFANEDCSAILNGEKAIEVIKEFNNKIGKYEIITTEIYKEIIVAIKHELKISGKNLFHPIRVALTAKAAGPELDKLIEILEEGKLLNLPKKIKGIKERLSEFIEYYNKKLSSV